MLEDTSFEPELTPEQIEAMEREQQDAEFVRRVRREVKRMQSGDAEQDIEQDEIDLAQEQAETEERQQAQEQAEAKAKRRQSNIFWQLMSGNILLREGVSKYYSQMILVAALFFVSIFVMFWSLHLDMRYSELSRTVQLTREKSIRLQEMKYLKCSRSAITSELERRGIDISEPTHPATIIDKKGW